MDRKMHGEKHDVMFVITAYIMDSSKTYLKKEVNIIIQIIERGHYYYFLGKIPPKSVLCRALTHKVIIVTVTGTQQALKPPIGPFKMITFGRKVPQVLIK